MARTLGGVGCCLAADHFTLSSLVLMRVRFLIDWPALSAEQARDPSVERYPAGAVADVHSDEFGQSAIAAGVAEITTDDVTYVWKAPEADAPAAPVAPSEPAVPDPNA